MHNLNSTQRFRPSNVSRRNTTDKKHKATEYYYKNSSNFTHRQQLVRDRLMQRKLENYVPGSGDKTTAILLITLIISGIMVETANAASTTKYSASHGKLPKDKVISKERLIHDACNSTNILPANRVEGWVSTRYNQELMRYQFYIRLPTFKSKETFTKEYKIREQKFSVNQQVRKMVQKNQIHLVEKIYRECGKPAEASYTELFHTEVEFNVMNYIVNEKIFLYQSIYDVYSSSDIQVIGNCFEMTAQASLIILPELEPDEEFFLEIDAVNEESNLGHVYGMIVPRNLLMGNGIINSNIQKRKFMEKFSYPFFNNGNARIKMGENHNECTANTALFWQALGISVGNIENEGAASQVKLCDPYMNSGLYCNGLENCFHDKETAQTYLLALDTITQIHIRTLVIPRELKPRINDFVKLTNDKINDYILELVSNTIKPAVKKLYKKPMKTEL